uniref:Protein ripply3 n=1 Tax=Latimeria chalumnae TaxID=7897 RepID=H3B4C6_LATCH
PALWRPWVLTRRDVEMNCPNLLAESDGEQTGIRSKGTFGFQHPVRLYLPKSKSHYYLYNIGEKVLASFPVQATIHFYNDDSDSEDDEDDEEDAEDL